jgi:hypothetical protein
VGSWGAVEDVLMELFLKIVGIVILVEAVVVFFNYRFWEYVHKREEEVQKDLQERE